MAHNYFSVADERSDSQNGISNIKLNLKEILSFSYLKYWIRLIWFDYDIWVIIWNTCDAVWWWYVHCTWDTNKIK